MASCEPFNRVVKLAARAFYDDISMKGDNQPKNFRGDNRGMAVVVLYALTRQRHGWVREEDLAKALKLHSKQLRRILCFFEEEKLITREHRKESEKGGKANSATATGASDGQPVTKEGKEKPKMHTHSYCCLDHAQICDVVRYRIHRMKKKLKDELDSRDTVQRYICHSCNKRYSAFDALQLVSYTDDYFHCESCNGELVAVSDKLAAEEMRDGEDNAKKCRRDQLKDMQQRIDEQLKPLIAQLERVKKLPAPEFGSLRSWVRENTSIRAFANGCPAEADSSRNPTLLIIPGDPKIIIEPGVDTEGGAESGKNDTAPKVMPPWMTRTGMNLTKEQRGEMPSKPDEVSEAKYDNKQNLKDEKTSIEDEYLKAYYEAWTKQDKEANRRLQHEGETIISDFHYEREVSKKCKREDENEGIEGEKDQAVGNTAEAYKLGAQESGDDADDGYEWVEG